LNTPLPRPSFTPETALEYLAREARTGRCEPRWFLDALALTWPGPPLCDACGTAAHPYMLADAQWQRLTPAGERLLCLYCVEARLGRGIEPADLGEKSGLPVNDWLFADTIDSFFTDP
jgi:hypothetical protein